MSSSKDKCLGAYLGAAIGDAMGGPVEGNHFARIKKYVGKVDRLLPYQKPYTLSELHPGYALHPEAGSITDDTYIRADMTRFFLENQEARNPELLANWLLDNADFSMWWEPAVEALKRVQRGEVKAEEGGLSFTQGGGIGWWTPLAIVHAGYPEKAAQKARSLARIWKAPLELDLLAAVVAGMAEALKIGADYEDVVRVIFAQCSGSLSRELLQRAVDIARQAGDVWDLAQKLYDNVLLPNSGEALEVDGPLPAGIEAVPYTDEEYTCFLYAEQIPLALAAFVYAKGDMEAIPVCCTLGRDCDSTATTVGAWVGALHGMAALPSEWVDTVCAANKKELDLLNLAEQIANLNNG